MPTDVIDLRPLAAERRWRWRLEESFEAEAGMGVRGDGRDYVEIVCQRGLIYPAGPDSAAATVRTTLALRDLVALGPDVRVRQRGDHEGTVVFPIALLDAVGAVLHPRRSKRGLPLSPAFVAARDNSVAKINAERRVGKRQGDRPASIDHPGIHQSQPGVPEPVATPKTASSHTEPETQKGE